jgi:mono/diheme cytochrome c family protein
VKARLKEIILIVLISVFQVFWGCDYARMKDQESVRTYEAEPPEMPEGTIPTTGGYEVLKASKPENLRNPLPSTQEVVGKGRTGYGYFCVMCHGPEADGNGTVGQSFAPLPADLKSSYVQRQRDGVLFYRMSMGYKRHPLLADTIAEEDRWAIVTYIRSLAKPSKR